MEILYLLIPLSLVLILLIGAVFWWAVDSGQFDDLDGPAHRILQDDDRPRGPAADVAAMHLIGVKSNTQRRGAENAEKTETRI